MLDKDGVFILELSCIGIHKVDYPESLGAARHSDSVKEILHQSHDESIRIGLDSIFDHYGP